MNKIVNLRDNIIKCKICGETVTFNIYNFNVEESEFTEIKILEDDYKYYINTRTGESIAVYKGD